MGVEVPEFSVKVAVESDSEPGDGAPGGGSEKSSLIAGR